jgi:hypothetical protein
MRETKRCPTCGVEKAASEFGGDRARADRLQSQCRLCKRATQVRWYEKNKARHVANVVRRRRAAEAEIIKEIISYLGSHPCVDCGETDPVVLEFDHVRGSKRNSVANLIKRGCGRETIFDEIRKCDVRCCKCHRLKTAKQFGYRKMLMNG